MLAQRLIALAALGLLGAIVGLALASGGGDSGRGTRLPARVGPWRYVRAAPLGRELEGATTACGVRLRKKTMGIADPVNRPGRFCTQFGG